VSGQPTGRAGRLALLRRLRTARAGVDLLERKRRILAGELADLDRLTERTAAAWRDAASQAAQWLARSRELDGVERLDASAPIGPARVAVEQRVAMGVRYPVDATALPPPPGALSGSSALLVTAAAHRAALAAAARHAAAQRSRALVAAELEATAGRRRALERRWIPRLAEQLHRLELQLDELEREEAVRRRWRTGPPLSGSLPPRTR
jgi:V/A-type H+/Na+-transporting ATPase subunit D